MINSEWESLKAWLLEHDALEEGLTSPGALRRLDLSGRALEALPETLGILTNLVGLNLGNNLLTELPASMAQLFHLNALDLRRNRFETLPELLRELPLGTLNVSGNRLSEIGVLAECPNLRVVDLSGNVLARIDRFESGRHALRTLNLSCNLFRDLEKCFTELGSVERLNLNGNFLTELPASVAAMHSLEELELSDNRLEKIDDAFFSLQLERLDLSSNRLASLNLRGLDALEKIVLDDNPLRTLEIENDFAPFLREFSCDSCGLERFLLPPSHALESLCYASNAITEVPVAIGNYARLTELDIDDNAIRELPDSLANLTELKTLYAEGNPLSEAARKVITVLDPEICDLKMKSGITIESAEERELPQMAQLLSLLFAIESDFEVDYDRQLSGIRSLYAHPECDLLVARHEGNVIGMVTMQRLISSAEGDFIGQVEDLVVREDYRKMGVGSRLLNTIRSLAESYGYKRIQLAADKENANAQKFYARRGFRQTHLAIFHYRRRY